MKGFWDGVGYRAIGIVSAVVIAIAIAMLVPYPDLGLILAILVGGVVGGFFMWLADKRTGRKPPPPRV